MGHLPSDPECGKFRWTSTYRMTGEGAEPDLDTVEWRALPEGPGEWQCAGFLRREVSS